MRKSFVILCAFIAVIFLPVATAVITVNDLLYVVDRLGTSDSVADINGDGVVDLFDLVRVASRIGYPRSTIGWNGEDENGGGDLVLFANRPVGWTSTEIDFIGHTIFHQPTPPWYRLHLNGQDTYYGGALGSFVAPGQTTQPYIDSTQQGPVSPGGSIAFFYPEGFIDGNSNGRVALPGPPQIGFDVPTQGFYAAVTFKLSDNWTQGRTDVSGNTFKFWEFSAQPGGLITRASITMIPEDQPGGAEGKFRLKLANWANSDEPTYYRTQETAWSAGEWVQFELLVMFNQEGVPGTGSMQLWTNGVLVGELHDTDLPFTQFGGGQATNVHGGGIGNSQENKYLWMDHAYTSIAPAQIESVAEPHYDFRFDELQSTQELLQNTMGLGLWRNEQDIALDAVQPLGGPANSMRYRYPDLTDEPTRCDDRYITSGTMLPEDVTEVWVEVVVRFMEGFTTRSPQEWNCPGANDLKFVYINFAESGTGGMPFLAYASSVGLNSNSLRLRTPSDVGIAAFSERSQEELFSGEWITLRFHARLPTIPDTVGSPGSGSGDGLYRLWWDDELEIEIADMSTAAYRFSNLLLGQNMNQGQDSPQDMWWNRIRVWTEDPGW